MDQQPLILELTTHAEAANWNMLGVKLELNNVSLDGCHDCTSMYQLWIEEKADKATRKSLLDTLSAIKHTNVAKIYEDYLKIMVSCIVHISIYMCTQSGHLS